MPVDKKHQAVGIFIKYLYRKGMAITHNGRELTEEEALETREGFWSECYPF